MTTLNKRGIAERIRREVGSMESAKSLASELFSIAANGLKNDGIARLSGVGSFRLLEKRARGGRNPISGAKAIISARRVVIFTASGKLKRAVANANE